jgi:hypothetical protein
MFRLIILTLLFGSLESPAQYIIRQGDEEGDIRGQTIVVPYIFSSETLGIGLGLGGSFVPKAHLQSLYYGALYGTDNGSWLAALGGYNLQIPNMERLYVRPYAIAAKYTHMRIYADGNPAHAAGPPAGSNESSSDNYIERDAYDMTLSFETRYILPWGSFRDGPVHTYIAQNGLLKDKPSGAESINPLKSGLSSILFRPYYRRQYTDVNGLTPKEELQTLYFQLGYEHDNRDFIPNPHRGYRAETSIYHDPNWLQSTRQWTVVEGQLDGFIPLPDTSWSRQQTVALSGWGSYAPTYDPRSTDTDGKPPYFAAPSLGGLWRMRGYPTNRFHDKAAIYYSVEYRIMPEWQPFGNINVLDPLDIQWWQLVGLVEAGRVAPGWNLETLHSDMKYDYGIGLRGMFHTGVGRIDFVVSEEGFALSAMFGQAF